MSVEGRFPGLCNKRVRYRGDIVFLNGGSVNER